MTTHRWWGLSLGPFVFGRVRETDNRPRRPRFFIGWIVVALILSASPGLGLLLALGLALFHGMYLLAVAVADTDDTEAPR